VMILKKMSDPPKRYGINQLINIENLLGNGTISPDIITTATDYHSYASNKCTTIQYNNNNIIINTCIALLCLVSLIHAMLLSSGPILSCENTVSRMKCKV